MATCAAHLLGALCLAFLSGGQSGSINRVVDLRAQMYTRRADATACVRLLNASGVIGCAADLAQGALLHLPNASLDDVPHSPAGQRVLLVEDAQLAFPQAELAPYPPGGWAWNPGGAGLLRAALPAPVALLDDDAATDARRRAAANARQGGAGAQHVAELRVPMAAAGNASACIAARACLPLGGHSVWATLPPLPANHSTDTLPLVLVLAGADGDALFHDQIRGAEAPLSGLVAMLATAEALGNASAAGAYSRRLVFAALAGEPWGLMGSRRLLWQMHAGDPSVQGLRLDAVKQVVELGMVGRAGADGGARTLFLHHQRGPEWGNATQLVSAFQTAAANAQGMKVTVLEASAGNPGIPPSSLMAFLRAQPAIAGAVLADFDSAFTTPFYHSRHDNASTVDEESIAAAAVVAARALHALAAGVGEPNLQVDVAAVRATVAMLAACLLRSEPGLACPLAQNLTAVAGDPAAPRYVGILRSLPADAQDPDARVVGDIARVFWNFLALRTAAGPARLASGQVGGCDFAERRCEAGAVCVQHRADRRGEDARGRCVNATARYVASHSNRLACQGCGAEGAGRWVETGEADAWARERDWPPDPMWTESNWPAGEPSFALFQRNSAAVERRALLGGCLLTASSFLAAWAARSAYEKRMKQL
ncbi:hypothetical protein WJX81_003488 [Elliptochloris bilobata]|uniref:Nicastrin n=1 Tax=Elliptochloris bilobata TaxID=381761 RepID=A0AAW1RGL6_9CHLO